MGPIRSASAISPCLLLAAGPVLILPFTFNFNNFNVIYLFNEGNPPIPNTPTPAGTPTF